MPRVLQLLSQRPSRTGSGVTLEALVREANRAGWEQAVVVGTPADDPTPKVGGLADQQVFPLAFDTQQLPFAVPGMSDVMPYTTTVFSSLNSADIQRYRDAWAAHLEDVLKRFQPDVIHAHHVWLLSALVKDIAPEVPVVVHGHATGLRQMELCPHLAADVIQSQQRNERFLALTAAHAATMSERLGLPAERLPVVGAGYRNELFQGAQEASLPGRHLITVGKLSRSKGLPWLLSAFERLSARDETVHLHMVGAGSGSEAAEIGRQAESLAPRVTNHGRLGNTELAQLLRRCDVFVLPSLYEGLPLVVIEALASGCRALCTDLPGVRSELLPKVGEAIDVVPLPRLVGPDVPLAEDLPAFVDALEAGLERALARPPLPASMDLTGFTWAAVFERVQRVWHDVIGH